MKKQIVFFILLVLGSILISQYPIQADTELNINENEFNVPPPPYLGLYITDFSNIFCQTQIQQAKIDIKNQKLVYEINSFENPRYEDEREELLGNRGIEYVNFGPNCTLDQECYGYYMDSIIKKRFGKNFFKLIDQAADSLFLSRWKTKFYYSWDIDEEPIFSKGDAEEYIEQIIKIPKKFDIKKEESQFLKIDVYISNEGKIKKWEMDEFRHLAPINQQFLPYFEREIDRVLKTMKDWTPGILERKNVNSKIWLSIYLNEENNGTHPRN